MTGPRGHHALSGPPLRRAIASALAVEVTPRPTPARHAPVRATTLPAQPATAPEARTYPIRLEDTGTRYCALRCGRDARDGAYCGVHAELMGVRCGS